MAIADLRQTAGVLRGVFEDPRVGDGYVSMEVAPDLSHDTAGTVAEAQRLWAAVDRPNLMIKVPGPVEGIPAIRHSIGEGISANITMLFSTRLYEQVVEAYLSGLENRVAGGGQIARLSSMARFFISPIDSAIDSAVDSKVSERLQGRVSTANGKLSYARFGEMITGGRWQALHARGALLQRILCTSIRTKNPALSDVSDVQALIGSDTLDTIPPATCEAFQAHGVAHTTLTEDLPAAWAVLADLAGEGVDQDEVTDTRVDAGLEKFLEAQRMLLASVEQSLQLPERLKSATLACSFPDGLGGQVDAVIEDWESDGKDARLWNGDAGLWTGGDEAHGLGWLGVAMGQLVHVDRFAMLVGDVRTDGFTHAVVLGMDGSSLCSDVLSLTIPATKGLPRLRVLDSTDPQQIITLESELDLSKTLFFVSLKSGTTLEPNIFGAYFRASLIEVLGAEEAGRHFVAIADPDAALERLAESDGYRAVFHGWPTIGGRYSTPSNFGMIPGAAVGVDVLGLLGRAGRIVHACAASLPAVDNPALQLGAIIGAAATAERDKITMIASTGIRGLGAWLAQLLAESTGKEGKGVIPVDWNPLSGADVYGPIRVFVDLRLTSDDDAEQETRVQFLDQAGQPVVRIVLTEVPDLGGEFFRWEFPTAVAGSMIGIGPFDQPDVEETKIATRKLTDAYDQSGSLPEHTWFGGNDGLRLSADVPNAAEIATATDETASLDSYLAAHLGGTEPGDYLALLAYQPMTSEREGLLREIRVLIRDRMRVATCVGFGPCFQYSTGQAYKAGPNPDVFLQITCQDTVDLPVTGHAYTFEVVKEAQARGDFDALADKGRRALRVDFGVETAAGLRRLSDAIECVLPESEAERR